jgi:hypothetical protein
MMTRQEYIDDIMDNFNFARVEKVMYALDWRWANVGSLLVPHESELRVEARKQLGKVYDYAVGQGRRYEMSTGGFTYLFDPQESYMSLKFYVEQRDSYEESYDDKGVPF